MSLLCIARARVAKIRGRKADGRTYVFSSSRAQETVDDELFHSRGQRVPRKNMKAPTLGTVARAINRRGKSLGLLTSARSRKAAGILPPPHPPAIGNGRFRKCVTPAWSSGIFKGIFYLLPELPEYPRGEKRDLWSFGSIAPLRRESLRCKTLSFFFFPQPGSVNLVSRGARCSEWRQLATHPVYVKPGSAVPLEAKSAEYSELSVFGRNSSPARYTCPGAISS